MSETEQKETEIVAGVIEGVTKKRSDPEKGDTWQVAVKPEGSNYTKNLWTKDAELVAALDSKLGQAGAFVCNASYWENREGKQVRSLWIAGEAAEGAESHSPAPRAQAQASTTPQRQNATEGMTPEKWDEKERRDFRSRAWAQSISALTHTIKTEESAGDVYRRIYALQRMIYRDIVRDFDPEAFPDDDVPFS